MYPSNASEDERDAVWDNIDYATIKDNTMVLSKSRTLSEGDASLLAIVCALASALCCRRNVSRIPTVMPARVAHQSTALHTVQEGIEASRLPCEYDELC